MDLPRLRAEWEEARAQEWSISEDEPDAGVLAMAAPLFNAQGEGVGAFALVAPAGYLLSQERRQWPPLVHEAAAHISQTQGYQGNEPQGDPVREEQRERGREQTSRAHP